MAISISNEIRRVDSDTLVGCLFKKLYIPALLRIENKLESAAVRSGCVTSKWSMDVSIRFIMEGAGCFDSARSNNS